MIRFIRSLFAWRDAFSTGKWLYQQNAVTGARRALEQTAGYQPLNARWLNGDGRQ